MKKYCTVAKFMIIVIALIIIVVCVSYNIGIGPVSKSTDNVVFKIEKNSTYLSISKELKEKNLIKSETFYKVYIKIFNPTNLQAGTYMFNESLGVAGVINKLENKQNDSVTITFREGLNMRQIAAIIESNTNNKKEDIYNLLLDENYLNEIISNYWFIKDEIKNNKLYYPLEGYLFPNTYEFANKDVSVKEIFKAMLDEMNNKLDSVKDKINNSKYSFHELLTLASIIELEVSDSGDRRGVASVFYNRLEDKWTLGSDVTTYYALKIDDWTGLTNKQLNACNDYNTRGTCFKGLPVGPICNPSIDSIKATVEYEETSDYYFIADCKGKNYFSKTQTEHDNIRKRLIDEKNWCS